MSQVIPSSTLPTPIKTGCGGGGRGGGPMQVGLYGQPLGHFQNEGGKDKDGDEIEFYSFSHARNSGGTA